jgi:hypothetical protein
MDDLGVPLFRETSVFYQSLKMSVSAWSSSTSMAVVYFTRNMWVPTATGASTSATKKCGVLWAETGHSLHLELTVGTVAVDRKPYNIYIL